MDPDMTMELGPMIGAVALVILTVVFVLVVLLSLRNDRKRKATAAKNEEMRARWKIRGKS